MNLGGIFGGKKKRRTTKKKSRAKKKSSGFSGSLPWILGLGLVVIMGGVGVLKWAQSRTGQASLLVMGSEKMYGEVQSAVDQVLVDVFPQYIAGPTGATVTESNPDDHDWPAPELASGAYVRCRKLAVDPDIPYRQLELEISKALEAVGAKVLWGQRLYSGRYSATNTDVTEAKDQLRLDLGVAGKPTHTLVLYRKGQEPDLRWGHGPGLSAWSQLLAQSDRPMVALVIDDWGYSKTQATGQLLNLPAPLTMAVLPGLSYSREFSLKKTDLVLPPDQVGGAAQVRQSSAAGRLERLNAGCFVEVSVGRLKSKNPERRREILLHLPMEPQGYPEPDPGPQAVMVGMGTSAIDARLDKALSALDRVTGVNNHMGSAATSDPETMKNLMVALEERGLLFLDSLTSARSVAYESALEQGIPALKNRIFLDYDKEDEQKIAANLNRLVQAARSSGFAVGIGHPHPATARVLAREVPRLVAEGVVFVTVSELYALQHHQQGNAH